MAVAGSDTEEFSYDDGGSAAVPLALEKLPSCLPKLECRNDEQCWGTATDCVFLFFFIYINYFYDDSIYDVVYYYAGFYLSQSLIAPACATETATISNCCTLLRQLRDAMMQCTCIPLHPSIQCINLRQSLNDSWGLLLSCCLDLPCRNLSACINRTPLNSTYRTTLNATHTHTHPHQPRCLS